jgi:hypothetical protein
MMKSANALRLEGSSKASIFASLAFDLAELPLEQIHIEPVFGKLRKLIEMIYARELLYAGMETSTGGLVEYENVATRVLESREIEPRDILMRLGSVHE